MGKAKIMGGGGGINIKNGVITEKYATVNDIPANTFVQNVNKGLNLYKNYTEMPGFGSDEDIGNVEIIRLNGNLFVLAYVDKTTYKLYVRTATLDKTTYTITLNNDKFDCNYPNKAYDIYPTMILKMSNSSFIVIHYQYAYAFSVSISGILTLQSATQIIEKGQVLAADYDNETQRVAIAQYFSQFISSYTYYKYARIYSVESDGLTELSNVYIESSSAYSETRSWSLKFLASTTILLNASTATTANVSSQLRLMYVDVQTGILSYDVTKRLNVSGLIYNIYILNSNRLVVIDKLQSNSYNAYVRLGTISQDTITWEDSKLVSASSSLFAVSRFYNNVVSIITNISQYDFRCSTFVIDGNNLTALEPDRITHIYPVKGKKCDTEISEDHICIVGNAKGVTLFVMSDLEGIVKSCEFINGVTKSDATKTSKGKVYYCIGGEQ